MRAWRLRRYASCWRFAWICLMIGPSCSRFSEDEDGSRRCICCSCWSMFSWVYCGRLWGAMGCNRILSQFGCQAGVCLATASDPNNPTVHCTRVAGLMSNGTHPYWERHETTIRVILLVLAHRKFVCQSYYYHPIQTHPCSGCTEKRHSCADRKQYHVSQNTLAKQGSCHGQYDGWFVPVCHMPQSDNYNTRKHLPQQVKQS